MDNHKTLIVEIDAVTRVATVRLNRPAQRNSLSHNFFLEFPSALSALDQNSDINVIILCAAGDHFCSGIDLSYLLSVNGSASLDHARRNERLRSNIMFLQDAVTSIERCRKPVIAAINGGCIGGGVDIVTACDIRYCTRDAFFSVKEVDLAITADIGTLQRLPAIVGYGNAAELALTGRRFSSQEAKDMGLVSSVFETKEELEEAVGSIAKSIGGKSPLAVVGTKAVLLKGRDLSVAQSLEYVATWNAGMLVGDDLKEAVEAYFQKRKPHFAKL